MKKGGQKNDETPIGTTQASTPVLDSTNEDFLQKVIEGIGEEKTTTATSQDLDLAVELEKAVDEELSSPESSNNSNHAGKRIQEVYKKSGRWFPFLNKNKEAKSQEIGIQNDQNTVSPIEAAQEEQELSQVLQNLELTAENNRACFLSPKSKPIVQKFTVILKDLINGVPTAYKDLEHLLDDSDGTLSKMYEKLPGFIKVLIAKLPDKIKGHLAPELIATAAQAPALALGSGISIAELISNPGAIYTMLRAIINVLKLRWPAFMGTNILLSMGLFVLLFVFWYCHKRGKEERLKQESRLNSSGRIEELNDDPMIENS